LNIRGFLSGLKRSLDRSRVERRSAERPVFHNLFDFFEFSAVSHLPENEILKRKPRFGGPLVWIGDLHSVGLSQCSGFL